MESWLLDTHNHLQDAVPFETSRIDAEIHTRTSVVMGTRHSDWGRVQTLAENCQVKIIPAFGQTVCIHPWFCLEAASLSSLNSVPSLDRSHKMWNEMEKYLVQFPNALVGEIGLDAVAKDRSTGIKFPFPLQIELFVFQIGLAARYHRPCSIHVVQCHGKIFDFLRAAQPSELPPRLALHSFTGSPDIAKGMVRLPGGVGKRIFFGISSCVSGRSRKVVERIKGIPDNRILLESDLYDPRDIDRAMVESLNIVSDAKGWTIQETAERTFRNAEEFLTGNRGNWDTPHILSQMEVSQNEIN
ncbi:hypothetical protein HK096_003883 [Nowakowskiella sp. JEL0078]|nr:hypothetical protein HK096_003883 [Nowakowskiella sp. JEL0078]